MTKLPTGWYEEPLNKFVDARSGNGKLIKGKQSVTKSEGLFPAFSASGQDIWTEKAEVSGPGIVVSAVGARCGKSFLTDGNWTAVANTHILQIKKDAQLDIKYLWYLCNDENWWIRSGTAQPFVKVKDTLERPQLLPPIHVQYKIVEILEDHLSRLDAALADVKQAKIKAAQFRRSLLQAAFTGNLSGDGSRLMTLPKSWEKSKLGDIGRYLNGKAFKSEEWKSTGRPIIRIQNLTGSGTEFNYFQGEAEDRYVVMPGDLLFSWSATLGTFIWQGPEAVLNQHIFKVESHIDKKFHRYLLDFKIQEMQSQTHGSGMVHITKKSFDAIEVHIPPTKEQHKIVEILEDHLSRLDASVAIADEMEKQSAAFRRSLLQAAFTGQLTKEVASV